MTSSMRSLRFASFFVSLTALISTALYCHAAVAAGVEDDYAYRTQPKDTLIGVSRRLLINPSQWAAIQKRNNIVNPTAIPVGTIIRIPREWLKQQSESAVVATVVGTGTIEDAPMRAGDTVRAGSHITTGPDGYVTIVLADGSVIKLNPNSAVELQQLQRYDGTGLRDTQIKVNSGSLETNVKPQGDAGRFQIRSPVAVSAVRGTDFRRAFVTTDAIDRTEVVGGAVAVSGEQAEVVVPNGFGTISDATGRPRAPVKLLDPPDLSTTPARFDGDSVRIEFAAIADAQSYRAQLARDSDFRDIAAETIATAPAISFASVVDGHYWIRVRSRDGDELEGPDAVREFDRLRLLAPPQVAVPAANAFVTGNEVAFAWQPVEGAIAYRFQLARDASFDASIGDHPRVEATHIAINDLAATSYFWRVAAIDAQGNAGHWGEAVRFSLKHAPGPIDAPRVQKKSMEFNWSGEPDQHFRLQIARDATFRDIASEHQVEDSHITLPRLRVGVYYARVQATDSDGYVGPFTPAQRFVVQAPWWIGTLPFLALIPLL